MPALGWCVDCGTGDVSGAVRCGAGGESTAMTAPRPTGGNDENLRAGCSCGYKGTCCPLFACILVFTRAGNALLRSVRFRCFRLLSRRRTSARLCFPSGVCVGGGTLMSATSPPPRAADAISPREAQSHTDDHLPQRNFGALLSSIPLPSCRRGKINNSYRSPAPVVPPRAPRRSRSRHVVP